MAPAFAWVYLAASLGFVLLSPLRERRSFFWSGLLNTVVALWFVGDRHEWLDRVGFAIAIVLSGLVLLGSGWLALVAERRRRA